MRVAGPDRSRSATRSVNDVMVRAVFEGSRGQAFVTVLFNEVGEVTGSAIKADEKDGDFGIIIGCTADQRQLLRAFYSMLVSGPLGFGDGGGHAPRWRDPAHPQQIHLDVLVPDPVAAEAVVLDHGATKLEETPGWRVYADPVGHPFCLYPGATESTDRLGVLARVVIDCPDPPVLAALWGALLDMPIRVEDSNDRIVVAHEDNSFPMIGLQRVAGYQAPRWPDPDYPAQIHFDIGFDDRLPRERLVLEMGGTRLPPQGGSCPVYADPAGHPFCLCYTGD